MGGGWGIKKKAEINGNGHKTNNRENMTNENVYIYYIHIKNIYILIWNDTHTKIQG